MHPGFTRGGFQPVERRERSGDGDGRGRINGADRQRSRVEARDQRRGGGLAQGDRGHPAGAMGGTLQQAALDDDVTGLFQGQRSAGPGGGDLTGAVADMRHRPHAHRPQRGDSGHLDREQQRLRDRAVADGAGEVVAGQPSDDRPSEFGRQTRVHVRQGGGECGVRAERVEAHAGPLAAVAGIDERDATAIGLARGDAVGPHRPRSQRSNRG